MSSFDPERYQPIADGLLVRPDEPETVTGGGIVLPTGLDQRATCWGTVLAAGRGFREPTGVRRAMDVRPGQRVLYPRFCGHEVKLGGEVLRALFERECLAVLNG